MGNKGSGALIAVLGVFVVGGLLVAATSGYIRQHRQHIDRSKEYEWNGQFQKAAIETAAKLVASGVIIPSADPAKVAELSPTSPAKFENNGTHKFAFNGGSKPPGYDPGLAYLSGLYCHPEYARKNGNRPIRFLETIYAKDPQIPGCSLLDYSWVWVIFLKRSDDGLWFEVEAKVTNTKNVLSGLPKGMPVKRARIRIPAATKATACRFSDPKYREMVNVEVGRDKFGTPLYEKIPLGTNVMSLTPIDDDVRKSTACTDCATGPADDIKLYPGVSNDRILQCPKWPETSYSGTYSYVPPQTEKNFQIYKGKNNVWHVDPEIAKCSDDSDKTLCIIMKTKYRCANPFQYILFDKLDDPVACYWKTVYSRTRGCFAPETQIRLANGETARVDSLRAGDWVWNPLLAKSVRVKRVVAGPEEKPLHAFTAGGRTTVVTEGHPMLTRSGLRLAKHVLPGEELRMADGSFETITNRTFLTPAPGLKVWNLELEGSGPVERQAVVANGIVTGDLRAQEALAAEGASSPGKIRVSAKSQCGVGDFDIVGVDLFRAKQKRLLLTVENLKNGDVIYRRALRWSEFYEGVNDALPTFGEGLFGVYVCKDSNHSGRCGDKPAEDLNAVYGRYASSVALPKNYEADDKIYYFQPVVANGSGHFEFSRTGVLSNFWGEKVRKLDETIRSLPLEERNGALNVGFLRNDRSLCAK